MRMPPLLADFTLARPCKPFCEKFLTLPPVAQKCLFPNLYFRFPCFSKIIIADFPFKYPIKLETQYFGGILNSRCTWSGII